MYAGSDARFVLCNDGDDMDAGDELMAMVGSEASEREREREKRGSMQELTRG